MSFDILVPTLPESVADATLVAWHKHSGDWVNEGDNLADLETDKVILEVPAPRAGVLGALLKQTGDTVVGGDKLASLDTEAAAPKPAVTAAATSPAYSAGPLLPCPDYVGGDCLWHLRYGSLGRRRRLARQWCELDLERSVRCLSELGKCVLLLHIHCHCSDQCDCVLDL